MRVGTVDTHAYHLIAGIEQVLIIVAQIACLGGASRSRVFGIEVKGYVASGIVAAPDDVAVLSVPSMSGIIVPVSIRDCLLEVVYCYCRLVLSGTLMERMFRRGNASIYEPGVEL